MTLFNLAVRQQPSKARLCSFKEKVDRRPIDPPPIIQLKSNQADDEYLQNPYFFLYATLTDVRGETDLHFVNGNRTTAGTVVQSLHKLKDVDNTDGGFFIFSDISVRLEGFYRLKFTLYEIEGPYVNRMCSIVSDVFQVYSPKSFPGMSESTFLTRSFSDQGVRIRIRKEPRSSSSNASISGKRRRRTEDMVESDEEEYSLQDQNNYMELSPMPRSQQQQSQQHHHHPQQQQQQQQQIPYQTAYFGRSPSPLPEHQLSEHTRYDYNKQGFELARPTLPSPKEIFRSSPMSMQNILSSNDDGLNTALQPPSTSYSPPPIKSLTAQVSVLFPPTPADDEHNINKLRLFTTRTLPLPTPHINKDVHSPSPVNKIVHPAPHHSTPTSSPSSNASSPWLHNRGQLPPPSSLSPPQTTVTTNTTTAYTSSASSSRRL